MSLKNWIKRLPPRVEFHIVVALAFGYFIVASILWLLSDESMVFSNRSLAFTALYEVTAFFIINTFLWVRGWRLKDFTRRFKPYDILIAIGFFALISIAFYILVF